MHSVCNREADALHSHALSTLHTISTRFSTFITVAEPLCRLGSGSDAMLRTSKIHTGNTHKGPSSAGQLSRQTGRALSGTGTGTIDFERWYVSGLPLPLIAACVACQRGVKRAHLVDARMDGALLLELYSRDGVGTMLSADFYEVILYTCILLTQCPEPIDDCDMANVLMLILLSTSARCLSANMQADRFLSVSSLTASLQVSSGTQYNCYLIHRKFHQYDLQYVSCALLSLYACPAITHRVSCVTTLLWAQEASATIPQCLSCHLTCTNKLFPL